MPKTTLQAHLSCSLQKTPKKTHIRKMQFFQNRENLSADYFCESLIRK